MKRVLTYFFVLFLVYGRTEAQTDTTLFRPNVVRWNITPLLVSGTDSWVFGYERVIKKNQSISANIGVVDLPFGIAESDSAVFNVVDSRSSGFSFTIDYRFYLGDRNKFSAPNGVYLSPYLGYFYFDSGIDWDVRTAGVTNTVGVDLYMNVVNLGAQLGYQFNFNDRWSVDLVLFGPSLSFYDVNLRANGELSEEVTESDAYKTVVNALTRIYPGSSDFFDTGELQRTGINTQWGPGFRYVIQVGYRF